MKDLDIFEIYKSNKDTEKALEMSAYMRNKFLFLVIPTPKRRELGRDFLKKKAKEIVDWEFIFKCWNEPEREFQYLARDYLRKISKSLTDSDIPNLQRLIITKSWWDTIDGLDTVVGDIALRFLDVNETLLNWSLDENFWLRRIAIDHQLLRKEKTDTALLEKIIVNNFGQTEFFINKAIGWALRDYSKTDPDWVRAFIKKYEDKMAPLSKKEASKYI